MDLISTQKIFLSKMSGFDDHFEGSYSPVMAFMYSGGLPMLERMVTKIPPSSDGSLEDRKRYKKSIEIAEKKVDDFNMSCVFKGYSYKDYGEKFEYLQHQHREWIDAICWHAGSSESMAMWKIYGENDNAVCIISDVSCLKQAVGEHGDTCLTLAKIEYINHSTDNFKIFHPLSPFIHKSLPYIFEQEYRLIAYKPDTNLLTERPSNSAGTLLKVNISKLIKEVRVSHKSPQWFFDMVERFSKEYISEGVVVTRSEMGNKAIFKYE